MDEFDEQKGQAMTSTEAETITTFLAELFGRSFNAARQSLLRAQLEHFQFDAAFSAAQEFAKQSDRFSMPAFLGRLRSYGPIRRAVQETPAQWIRANTEHRGTDGEVIEAHFADCWRVAAQQAADDRDAVAYDRMALMVYGHAKAAYVESGYSTADAIRLADAIVGGRPKRVPAMIGGAA